MTDSHIAAKKYFNVSEKNVPDEYKTIKNAMMKTSVKQYSIDGVGNMAVQNAKAMFGMMKMDMMCITPLCRDLPLFSFDVINAMGNYTLIIEIYDVMLEKNEKNTKLLETLESIKAEYSDLPDNDLGEHWYDNLKCAACVSKKGKKKDIAEKCDELYGRYLETYLSAAKDMDEVSDKAEKCALSDSYVQGLLDNGGPSTDQFVKMLGIEKTTEYFKKIIFGTAE